MADRPRPKNRAKLIDLLKKKLTNPDFISQFRTSSTSFIRNRIFSFKILSLFIISNIQSSIQRDLDRFFKNFNDSKLAERFVSQSAFSQARKKIKPEAFEELSKMTTQHFYSNYEYNTWRGFRLLAIDGSEVLLPKTKETIKEFGEYTTNFMKKKVVLARVSKLHDVLNEVSLDAKLVNKKTGEHALAKQHFQLIGPMDLTLLDRGYPSYDLFREVLSKGGDFCARVAVDNWKAAKQLVESGETEMIISIKPGYTIRKKYKEEGIDYEPIKCRFVRIELSSGEQEVIVTSLLDKDKYPASIFGELYHLRWDIEESYKKDKHRLQLENFSGKSVIAILQDFHANILLGNITSILAFPANEQIRKKPRKTKHRYKINMTTALSKVRDVMALLFNGKNHVGQLIDKLIEMFLKNLTPIRPGRSYKRERRVKRRYYRTYSVL